MLGLLAPTGSSFNFAAHGSDFSGIKKAAGDAFMHIGKFGSDVAHAGQEVAKTLESASTLMQELVAGEPQSAGLIVMPMSGFITRTGGDVIAGDASASDTQAKVAPRKLAPPAMHGPSGTRGPAGPTSNG